MVEHRIPVLNGALYRAVDPALSPDPRVRAVVAALEGLPAAPAPREHFRAELRAQLVAVTPRLVNEGMEGLVRHTPESFASGHVRASRWHTLAVRMPKVSLGTPVRLVTAALAVIVLLASGAVWLSRSALPGDPLYNLKRASENAQLSLESGTAKARELLGLAQTRVHEVADMLSIPSASGQGSQADGAVSGHTASLVGGTLGSADDDLRQAATLLGNKAVRAHSTAPLKVMLDWAPGQRARLDRILERLPAGSVHDRAASSRDLVAGAYARAEALSSDLDCGCLNASGSDALGPLPCTACRLTSPTIPTPGGTSIQPQVSQPKTGTDSNGKESDAGTGRVGTITNPGGGAASSQNPAGSGSSLPGPLRSGSLPSLPLPTLPLHTSTAPLLGINSCGASVAVGPIGIGLGTCGVHLHL